MFLACLFYTHNNVLVMIIVIMVFNARSYYGAVGQNTFLEINFFEIDSTFNEQQMEKFAFCPDTRSRGITYTGFFL